MAKFEFSDRLINLAIAEINSFDTHTASYLCQRYVIYRYIVFIIYSKFHFDRKCECLMLTIKHKLKHLLCIIYFGIQYISRKIQVHAIYICYSAGCKEQETISSFHIVQKTDF